MSDSPPIPKPRLTLQSRLTLLYFLGAAPFAALGLTLLWLAPYEPRTKWTLTVVTAGFWLACAAALRERLIRPLQTLANILEAVREEDYSMRARRTRSGDVLGEVIHEVNTLGEVLREKRLGAMEASALLRAVVAEIDVAIFTFDHEQRLRLINRAAERLLAQPAERLLGLTAEALGLGEALAADSEQTIQRAFPGATGRWVTRTRTFRDRGVPHRLLVVADVTRSLREEELQAWKRLVRVLGHELNNSLAPIKSIAGSTRALLSADPLPPDWRDDAASGLGVIETRAESLSRFLDAYARLARLPQPVKAATEISACIRRAAALETRVPVRLAPGPEIAIAADADQLGQLLINLLRNAAEASLDQAAPVEVAWTASGDTLEIVIRDSGPGVANPANLFVPFFTTKPNGTGIGLVLCRQIAEAHGGTLTLDNRTGAAGCEARLRLPV